MFAGLGDGKLAYCCISSVVLIDIHKTGAAVQWHRTGRKQTDCHAVRPRCHRQRCVQLDGQHHAGGDANRFLGLTERIPGRMDDRLHDHHRGDRRQ